MIPLVRKVQQSDGFLRLIEGGRVEDDRNQTFRRKWLSMEVLLVKRCGDEEESE